MNRSALLVLLGLSLMATAASAASSSQDTVYPSQLMKNRPELAAQYQTLVKPVSEQHGWVSQGGTETPVTHVSFGGHDYAVLSSCKPHDCASQNLVALMRPGSPHAVGALVVNQGDDGMGPKASQITWLGDPGQDQRRFMGAYLFR